MRPVRPWDLIDPRQPRSEKSVREERLAVCRACEHFMVTSQCSRCGCFMPAKVLLANAECPVGKWGQVEEVPE